MTSDLCSYFDVPIDDRHLDPDLQRQLDVRSRSDAEPHQLVAARVERNELQHLGLVELVDVDRRVQLGVLGPDPLLRLDRDDVPTADHLAAASTPVVDADFEDRRAARQEGEAEETNSRLVPRYVTVCRHTELRDYIHW